MIKLVKKLNIIIILLILTGCKQKNNSLALFSDVIPNQYEKNVHDMDIASSQAIDIDVDKNPLVDKIKISSWVDSISFVQLSSSDNALMGSINKLIRKSNDIYILDRYTSQPYHCRQIINKTLFHSFKAAPRVRPER